MRFGLRNKKELEPLNNGTPFILKPQDAKINTEGGRHTRLSALLRQSPNGRMTVSIFNTSGLNHKYNEYYTPGTVELDKIDLNTEGENIGLPGGLKSGTKFKNIDPSDNTIYYVNDKNQILYSVPDQLTFTGRKVLYNPQYNFVSQNSYKQKQDVVTGSKLAILSK